MFFYLHVLYFVWQDNASGDPEYKYSGSATMSASAGPSSIDQEVEKARKAKEHKERFTKFYDDVKLGYIMKVTLEVERISPLTKETSFFQKQERHKISERFLNANATMIQTVFRLFKARHKADAHVALTIPLAVILLRPNIKAIMTLEGLSWQASVWAYTLPKRGIRSKHHQKMVKMGCTFYVEAMRYWARKLMLVRKPPPCTLPSATFPSILIEPRDFQYHVVNKTRNKESLAEFTTRARAAGLPQVNRFDAIGEDLDLDLYIRQVAVTCHAAEIWKKHQNNFGDLACMLSHVFLWKRIAREPGVHIIFEDDADVPLDFLDKLKGCLPALPSDFQYAYLGHDRLHLTHANT